MNACFAVWSEKKILCCASNKFYYFYVCVCGKIPDMQPFFVKLDFKK